jgi:hypothetical protein
MKKAHLLLLICLGLGAWTPPADAQYTFGSLITGSTGSGGDNENLTYNSTTNAFQYTDGTSTYDDYAELFLGGSAASLVTTSNYWSANLTVSLSGATLVRSEGDAFFTLELGLESTVGSNSYLDTITLKQQNQTGDNSFANFPQNTYGTAVVFESEVNNVAQSTTTLGSASNYNGTSYILLSGGTNSNPTTESVSAATAVLNLGFNKTTDVLTGSYDGSPIGSISLSNMGANPDLLLGVGGISGEGINVYPGMDDGSNFSVIPEPNIGSLFLLGLAGMAIYGLRFAGRSLRIPDRS